MFRSVPAALIVAAVLLLAATARSGNGGAAVVADDTGIRFTRSTGCHDYNCVQIECPPELNARQRKAHAALTWHNRRRVDALSCWERLDFLAQYTRLLYSAADYNKWIDDSLDQPTPLSASQYKQAIWLAYPALTR